MDIDYQYGYCHYFADIIIDEIRKLVPNDFPINYYLILAERLDDDGEVIDDVLIHVYIKVGDYDLDSEGFHIPLYILLSIIILSGRIILSII